ncbi:MAG TPA: phosphate ABC transporter substrate-binding protein [Gammaproteobacteria bacterium]|nr:phosphate ABC transporter substrate-binding protein [Gammaproteobacteria bacterium]
MLNNIQKIIPVLLGLFILTLAQSAVADIVVITNKASNVDTLSASQVKALFLQKEKSFADGSSVMLSDQNSGSAVRKEFGKKILGKSQKKLKRYWSKRVFAGKGVPPKVVGDDTAVKEWVAKTPNSLGYINADALDDSVKVVFKP